MPMATAIERVLAGRGEAAPASEQRPSRPFVAGAVLSVGSLALAVWSFVDALTGPVTEAGVVRAAIAVVWALAGVVLVRRPVAQRIGVVALGAAALGAAACLWESVRPVAAALLPAAGMHLLLAYPERLETRARFITAVTGYAVAVLVALVLFLARPDYPAWPVGVEIALALLVGVGASLARYGRSSGPARKRLEWLGGALTGSAGVAL